MAEPIHARRSLLWRLFLANTAVIVAVFALLALTPASITSPLNFWEGGLYSLLGLALVVAVNLVVMRRGLTPLTRLTAAMDSTDPLRPGQRVAVEGGDAEVVRLSAAFNDMLERLEREREESLRRTLEAQESERLAIARNLHDEIGQRLTALMLQLDYIAAEAGSELQPIVDEARESARRTIEETRRLAKSLRPEVLDQLGLRSALVELTDRIAAHSQIVVDRALTRDLPPLSREVELVIYRVAQESLTNVLRHSRASRVTVELGAVNEHVTLRVADDGRGAAGEPEGAGLRGVRERAMMVGGRVAVGASEQGGVVVALDVPVHGTVQS